MKCAAFLVADLLNCQNLSYNKLERVSKNPSVETEISGAQGMSVLGGLCILCRRGCLHHATFFLAKVKLSLIVVKISEH